MAAVLRYTVVRVDPQTGVAHALKEGTSVPEWAEDLVHEDDLVEAVEAPAREGSDVVDSEALEAAETALKAAEERIEELEGELKTAVAEKFAALGHPEGEPSESWKVAELEAYAASKGVDISSAKNNPERVAALKAAAGTGN